MEFLRSICRSVYVMWRDCGSLPWRAVKFPIQLYKALIWLTLYGSALHFFDNYYFFDQYPEPAWLTAEITGALWIPLALLAHRAVD
jgi:hypothetical protein